MSDANQIRINELARELEIKAKVLIDYLPEIGVTEKKTHSSSIDVEHAELARKHFQDLAAAEAAAEAAKTAAKKARAPAAPAAAPPTGRICAGSRRRPCICDSCCRRARRWHRGCAAGYCSRCSSSRRCPAAEACGCA